MVTNVRRDTVDTFFEALDIMHELVEMRLEVVEKIEALERFEGGVELLRRMEILKERGVNVCVKPTDRLRGL